MTEPCLPTIEQRQRGILGTSRRFIYSIFSEVDEKDTRELSFFRLATALVLLVFLYLAINDVMGATHTRITPTMLIALKDAGIIGGEGATAETLDALRSAGPHLSEVLTMAFVWIIAVLAICASFKKLGTGATQVLVAAFGAMGSITVPGKVGRLLGGATARTERTVTSSESEVVEVNGDDTRAAGARPGSSAPVVGADRSGGEAAPPPGAVGDDPLRDNEADE